MIIEKLKATDLKSNPDFYKEEAKNIIIRCIEQGEGIYKITDDKKTFPSKTNMVDKLKKASYLVSREQTDFKIKIKTKDNMEKIYVIVSNSRYTNI